MSLDIAEPQVLVNFPLERIQWQHYVLLRRLRDSTWVVLTADLLTEVQDLSQYTFVPLGRGSAIPANVAARCNLFAPGVEVDLAGFHAQAARLATILGGRVAGLSHAAATEFSFLVGLLTLSAASVYKMWALGPALSQVYPAGPASVGLLVAAVTAFVSVKWLVGYVSRNGLGVFAWYRIALGGVILATLALK